MWFTLLMCLMWFIPYVVQHPLCVLMYLMWFITPYVLLCALCGSSTYMVKHPLVFLCALCGSNLPTITPSSKQCPHHFINFSTLNQFNFKILLINSLVVFRNDDFIKAQFFRFIYTLFNTIHWSHFS